MTSLSRAGRQLARSATIAGLATLVAASTAPHRDTRSATRAEPLRIGVVLPADSSRAPSIERGVTIGSEEAARSAALFGQTVEVLVERSGRSDAAAATQRLLARNVAALVSDRTDADCHTLSASGREPRALHLDIGIGDCDQGRGAADPCTRMVFRIYPAPRTGASDRATALELWHDSLSRFGAEQLNERFTRRFGAKMDSPAWAAWLAIKIVAEAALRAESTRAEDLAHYLRRGSRFDGHKGQPLWFDAASGALRQPLYVVESTGVIREVRPDVGTPPTTSRDGSSCNASKERRPS